MVSHGHHSICHSWALGTRWSICVGGNGGICIGVLLFLLAPVLPILFLFLFSRQRCGGVVYLVWAVWSIVVTCVTIAMVVHHVALVTRGLGAFHGGQCCVHLDIWGRQGCFVCSHTIVPLLLCILNMRCCIVVHCCRLPCCTCHHRHPLHAWLLVYSTIIRIVHTTLLVLLFSLLPFPSRGCGCLCSSSRPLTRHPRCVFMHQESNFVTIPLQKLDICGPSMMCHHLLMEREGL